MSITAVERDEISGSVTYGSVNLKLSFHYKLKNDFECLRILESSFGCF